MNFTTTLLFYVVIGAAVAVAVHLTPDAVGIRQRVFRTLSAIVFWPLYLPVLLARPASPPEPVKSASVPRDEIAAAIAQVEAELDLALASLDGWSDAVLAREQHRFAELRAAWHAQADKIRQLDRLLEQPVFAESTLYQAVGGCADQSHSRAAADSDEPMGSSHQANLSIATSRRARQANVERLRALRDEFHADLTSTLARVRELVTLIHLARYTGAPASRAEELVVQIATSIEGLSEVAAWQGAETAGELR